MTLHAVKIGTRWYPWGIQQLVSTYEIQTNLPNFSCLGGGEEVVLQTNSNSKCQDLLKFSLGRGTPDQLKMPRSAQIFIGRGHSRPTFLKYLSGGHSRNFEPKFLATGMCSASQIVSHILRMWRLTNCCGATCHHMQLCDKFTDLM